MQKIKYIIKGDIVAFKTENNNYKALLCTSTNRDKSPHYFSFAALTYDSPERPTLEDIQNCNFFGIGNRKNDYFKYSDQELDKMWRLHPDIKPYFLGSYDLTIWRKDFMKFRENLEYIGNVSIVDNLDKNGNGGMNVSEWIFLKDFFNQKYLTVLIDRGQRQFSVESIIRD
jgi:hypothetical protein